MRATLRTFGSFLFVMLIAVGALHADSDRYYCVGPGYIAYQFGMAAPSKAPHVLHVVRAGEYLARRARCFKTD